MNKIIEDYKELEFLIRHQENTLRSIKRISAQIGRQLGKMAAARETDTESSTSESSEEKDVQIEEEKEEVHPDSSGTQ